MKCFDFETKAMSWTKRSCQCMSFKKSSSNVLRYE